MYHRSQRAGSATGQQHRFRAVAETRLQQSMSIRMPARYLDALKTKQGQTTRFQQSKPPHKFL